MDIILMRHGRAVARGSDGMADESRPLTPDGIKRLKKALPGLGQVVPQINRVVSSPLLRARQTADLVVEWYQASFSELPALAPGGDFLSICNWLGKQKDEVILLVGHEPDLGRLASRFLTGSEESFLPMKKGAICLLHFEGKPAMAQAELRIWLSAAQLRALAH